MRVATLTAALVLMYAPALVAQQTPTPTPTPTQTRTPADRRTVVTINPFGVVLLYLAGDFETKVGTAVTLGGGGSIAGGDDFDSYRALDVKLRYYPNEKALYGFSIAATAGFVSEQREEYSNGFNRTPARRYTRGSVGTDLSYQWLLGPRDGFVTVVGLGVKRLVGSLPSDGYLFDWDYIPTARINVGFAF